MSQIDSTPHVIRNALVLIAVIACGVSLFWLRDILTPLAMAMFLAVTIDGLTRALTQRFPKLPAAAALPISIVLTTAVLVVMATIVVDNARSFAGQFPVYLQRLEALYLSIAAQLKIEGAPSFAQLMADTDFSKYTGAAWGQAQKALTSAAALLFYLFLVLIYLAFIIASRRGFRRKIVGMFPHNSERTEAMEVFHRIRNGVEQYLWVQTVTGLMIAGGSLAVMWALGLNNALFWAFLIFLASYIPIIGGFVGIVFPPMFALVQYDTYWQAPVMLGVLWLIQFIVGNIVQPKMQGDSLNIDPVVVLLSLAVWGMLWGPVGTFLSTPLTVAAMIILAQFQGTRWIAILLSANGEPGGQHRPRLGSHDDESNRTDHAPEDESHNPRPKRIARKPKAKPS